MMMNKKETNEYNKIQKKKKFLHLNAILILMVSNEIF